MRNQFVISGILEDDQVGDKLAFNNVVILEKVLSEYLKLSNYGDVVGIAFIFMVTTPGDSIHEEEFTYRPKKKEIYIQMRLPYQEVENASETEVLHLMAAKYLQTLQKHLPKKKIAHFDSARFTQDVQHLFEQQGWLASVEAA